MKQISIINRAVALLCQGDVIAIPTETVYGLAADADDFKAVSRIFQLKGRPADHPVIVHIANESQLADWAINIPDAAYKLTHAFWPGPLTLILEKAPHVLNIITGGQDTIGLRAPLHPITHEILKQFGGGVAAPSANKFGQLSPTTAQHVAEVFKNEIPLIVDGGPCQIGIESTIVDLSGKNPYLLRPGNLSIKQLEAVLEQPVLPAAARTSVRVSGSLLKHYAPKTPARLVDSNELEEFITRNKGEKKLAVLTRTPLENIGATVIVMPNDPRAYAALLYQKLHELDQLKTDLILIETAPNTTEWQAIADRLQRATG